MRYGYEALCDRCFMTGVDNNYDPKHDVRPGGVQVFFNPTELRIWMAPYTGESGPRVRAVARLTDVEVAAMAEYILDASEQHQWCHPHSGNIAGLCLDGHDNWLRIYTNVPIQARDREELELSTIRAQGECVRALAFMPFASHNRQPHRGEAERFGKLLASMRNRDPDEFLRRQMNENLKGVFL